MSCFLLSYELEGFYFFVLEMFFPFVAKVFVVGLLHPLQLFNLPMMLALLILNLSQQLDLRNLLDLILSSLSLYILRLALKFFVVLVQDANEIGRVEVRERAEV